MTKVSTKSRLKHRIAEKQLIAKRGIENAGHNASTFWQGYDTALTEIKNLIAQKL